MIFTFIAYDSAKNLGAAYNRSMKIIGPRDWGCFVDHDAMWTTADWYRQLEAAVRAKPDAGMFTAVTNRIGSPHQRVRGVDPNNHDIRYHRARGRALARQTEIVDVTDVAPTSGVVMCLSRRVWRRAGGFKSGMLGVDNAMHASLKRRGLRIYLLPGLYVYHWYRGDGDKSHLRGAKVA